MTHPTDLSRPSCVSGGAYQTVEIAADSRLRVLCDVPPSYDDEDMTVRQGDVKAVLAANAELTTAIRTARDLLAHHAPQVPTEKWIDGMAVVDAALKRVGG